MGFYSHLSLIAVGVELQHDQILAVHDAVVRAGVVTTQVRRVWSDFRNTTTRPSLWSRIKGVPAEVVMGRSHKALSLAETQKLLISEYSQDGHTELGILTPGVGLAFEASEARKQNTAFFTPDTVALASKITIQDADSSWESPGVEVSLHGNGYLFPWTMDDVRATIQDQPILQDLAGRLERLISVPSWSPPDMPRALVEKWTTWTPGSSGWGWSISQSM